MAARKSAPKAKEAAPPVQLAQLERALAGDAPLARGYLVRGEERWFRDAAVSSLVAAAERRGLEIVRHDAADPDFDSAGLQGDLTAAPMFAGARLVLVRSVSQLLKKEDQEGGAPIVAAASSFLRGRSVPGTLVLETETLRVDHALATAVKDAGGTILSLRRLWDTPPPWAPDPAGSELVQWLLARAKTKGVRLDPREAVYVATATGNELSALDQALDDVMRRGKESVKAVVGSTGAGSPFQLSEDLLRGDPAAAVAGIEQLFRAGMRTKEGAREVKPEATLAVLMQSLRSKLRATLAVARAQEAGFPPPPETGRGSPRAVEELRERSSLRTARAWARMSDDLAELERRTRTSRTVDASDLARLALRWRREQATIRPRKAAR
ncbi:MAG: DNA polymerase III subunit delta [Planctomycetota bacterium]